MRQQPGYRPKGLTTLSREERQFKVYDLRNIFERPEFRRLDEDVKLSLTIAARVFPFRVNNYVIEELIDWDSVPNDPIYTLLFPQRGMLRGKDFTALRTALASGAPEKVEELVRRIQLAMNPHPAQQMEKNRPHFHDRILRGLQHKYRQTVLFFPSTGQTCHSYCAYCFRWAQFVGITELKFAEQDSLTLTEYLVEHPEVTDVLVTGGDPMTMTTKVLERYLTPLLEPQLSHVANIRIGTKSIAFWPYRYTTDPEAEGTLRLFERIVRSGKQLAIMTHFSHPRELSTRQARDAISRIRSTGAVIRAQEPIIRNVNNDPTTWTELWGAEVRNGIVPYYMYVERNTGAQDYFKVSLNEALTTYTKAIRGSGGLARTARGPVMSCSSGKVLVDGRRKIGGEEFFILKYLQARDPSWIGQMFLAHFDPDAAWIDELTPAGGDEHLFPENA